MPATFRLSIALLAIPLLAQTFTNPFMKGEDPYILFDHGNYYYMGACGNTTICLRTATSLTGLSKVDPVKIWTAPAAGPNAMQVWAPELHKVEGKWVIYYAADPNNDDSKHKLFVLVSTTADPKGPYQDGDTGLPNGQIKESTGNWGIDPDEFTASDGHNYLTWSCKDSANAPQNICVAQLTDATHVGETVRISVPTEPWEERSGPIEEGPVGYSRNGHTFITYSGSASWVPNAYTVGLLKNTTGRILDPGSWVKTGPIFDRHATAFGAGSVIFVPSPNGAEWWNLYHGIDRMDCSPAYKCRDLRLQPMFFLADGTPELGYPVDPGVAVPLPAGEPGAQPLPQPKLWGNSYGDAAEGHFDLGKQSGNWQPRGQFEISGTSMGGGWMQSFSELNPNYENYTLNVDVQLTGTGGESTHRYGVYAAYADASWFVGYFIDPVKKVISSYGKLSGQERPFADCPLPADFDPRAFNNLKISKAGTMFTLEVNGEPVSGPCTARPFSVESGQVGVATLDATAAYKNFQFENVTEQAVPGSKPSAMPLQRRRREEPGERERRPEPQQP